MIRYTVTAIKKDGTRQLAFDNNHLKNWATPEEAEKRLSDTIANNNRETILECIGTDLQVRPVECWDSGDAKGIYFDN